MTDGPLVDLSRRLAELAESGGPWDDPLPEIRRRAENASATARLTADPTSPQPDPMSPQPQTQTETEPLPPATRAPAGPQPQSQSQPRPSATRAPAGPSSVTRSSVTFTAAARSSTATRRPHRWLPVGHPATVGAAAAVVALVAGLGWLIHAGGPAPSEKSATQGSAHVSGSAAGAAGARTSAGDSATTTAVSCVWPDPTSAVILRAPARVRTAVMTSVAVRLSGPALSIRSPLIVALSRGQVVGRLVSTFIPPGPRSSSPPALSADLTGTLRRSTCAQALAARGSEALTSSPRPALPPGRYQLVAVTTMNPATMNPATMVSAPVTVTVVR